MNRPVAVTDLVGIFKQSDNEEGTYLIQHQGQCYAGTARRGSSLEALTPVGQRVPIVTNGLSSEPWVVTKLSNEILSIADLGGNRSRSQQSQQY